MRIGKRTVLAKSCARCGKLKQRSDFRLTRYGYVHSYCMVCHQVSVAATNSAMQETTVGGEMHRQPWTEKDLTQLIQLVRAGTPRAEIAKRLRRTMYAITVHTNRNRYFIDHVNYPATPGAPIDMGFVRAYIEENAA